MRRIFPFFRTRRPTNFKLGRRTEPRFAKVTILILLLRAPFSDQSPQQHEESRGLSAIAELLVSYPCMMHCIRRPPPQLEGLSRKSQYCYIVWYGKTSMVWIPQKCFIIRLAVSTFSIRLQLDVRNLSLGRRHLPSGERLYTR